MYLFQSKWFYNEEILMSHHLQFGFSFLFHFKTNPLHAFYARENQLIYDLEGVQKRCPPKEDEHKKKKKKREPKFPSSIKSS